MKSSNHPKCAVVTGASGGVGIEICKELLSRGFRVLALTKRQHSSKELRKRIREHASQVDIHSFDFCELEAIEHLATIIEKFSDGTLDLLINNAGIGFHCRISAINTREMRETFLINTMAPILLTSRLLPCLQNAPSGHIINITSILVEAVMPFTGTYTASKRALDGFFQVLRRECGIRVTNIEPGAINTAFLRNINDPPVLEHFLSRKGNRLEAKEVARWVIRAAECDGSIMPGRIQIVPTDQVL